MKILLGKEYMRNPQDTTVDIAIDAKATSNDGVVVLLERTLSYTVNTANEGWRDQAISALKEQRVKFELDADGLLDMENKILNISADVAKAV